MHLLALTLFAVLVQQGGEQTVLRTDQGADHVRRDGSQQPGDFIDAVTCRFKAAASKRIEAISGRWMRSPSVGVGPNASGVVSVSYIALLETKRYQYLELDATGEVRLYGMHDFEGSLQASFYMRNGKPRDGIQVTALPHGADAMTRIPALASGFDTVGRYLRSIKLAIGSKGVFVSLQDESLTVSFPVDPRWPPDHYLGVPVCSAFTDLGGTIRYVLTSEATANGQKDSLAVFLEGPDGHLLRSRVYADLSLDGLPFTHCLTIDFSEEIPGALLRMISEELAVIARESFMDRQTSLPSFEGYKVRDFRGGGIEHEYPFVGEFPVASYLGDK